MCRISKSHGWIMRREEEAVVSASLHPDCCFNVNVVLLHTHTHTINLRVCVCVFIHLHYVASAGRKMASGAFFFPPGEAPVMFMTGQKERENHNVHSLCLSPSEKHSLHKRKWNMAALANDPRHTHALLTSWHTHTQSCRLVFFSTSWSELSFTFFSPHFIYDVCFFFLSFWVFFFFLKCCRKFFCRINATEDWL